MTDHASPQTSTLELIYTTMNSIQIARCIAKEALKQNLVACVNIFPELESFYKQDAKIINSLEYGVLFKVAPEAADTFQSWLLTQHPYDLPALIRAPATTTDDYGMWIHQSFKPLKI